MKTKIKNILPLLTALMLSFSAVSCIDEVTPTSVVSSEQVASMSDVQSSMLWGISAYMVKYNAWGASDYYNDWGYPCQMYFRELCGPDFPVYKSTYDYWTYYENATYTSSYPYYTWNYYYRLIKNCNNLIAAIDSTTANADSRRYLGSALAFRALAYMDLAQEFEFKPTGFEGLDQKASDRQIWGLTVPIVTETTTSQDILQNPRVDFCTMYRFIMTDLNNASALLDGYEFGDKSLPGSHAVEGLMARAWMIIGSRYEETLPQLQGYAEKMQASDEAKDGYDALGVYTASECYTKAIACADKAMDGYTPVTRAQWTSKTEGFNTVNDGWIWRMRIGGKEQMPTYYCSYLGQTNSEASGSMAQYAEAYRCMSSELFGKMGANDWRRASWVSPEDHSNYATWRSTAFRKGLLRQSPYKTMANAAQVIDSIYDAKIDSIDNVYQTLLSDDKFEKVPAYANLKFRPGSGNLDDYNVWLISDLPVMRMEEMKFIKMEATARTQGYAAGMTLLKDFMNSYRISTGSYEPATQVTDLQSFLDEMMIQKRIEFWGEGVCYFDFKRMNTVIDRTTSTNVEDAFLIKSREGYCCPWLNFFIMQYETNRNSACIANPDVSNYFDTAE